MAESLVFESALRRKRFDLRVILAFLAIYVLWGSTYLAVRILVQTIPPLFGAGVRFCVAGAILYIGSILAGEAHPSRREWRSIAVLAALMILGAYGGLFWAEQTLPSGLTSVLVATIPVWTLLIEVVFFNKRRLNGGALAAILLGFAGVVILVGDSGAGAGRVTLVPCLVILFGELSWSFGTVLNSRLALPASKRMSAAGQMLTGGVMLMGGSALLGEMHTVPHFSPRALGALAYMTIAGSLIGYTCYEWLLHRMPASTVTSYAYVNPIVALAIGYWLGNEALTARMIVGAIVILASVAAILRGRPQPA
jgi:drug/metabolite transporter (DMT)-like permease